MKSEVYFLKYAFPCARVAVDVQKVMTEEEYAMIEDAVKNDKVLDREVIERLFPKAFRELHKLADDPWKVEVIRDYFWNKHDKTITPSLPPTVKRLCVVKKGKIEKKLGEAFRVRIDDDDVRVVLALYDAEVGDEAMIHYGYAVEKFNP